MHPSPAITKWRRSLSRPTLSLGDQPRSLFLPHTQLVLTSCVRYHNEEKTSTPNDLVYGMQQTQEPCRPTPSSETTRRPKKRRRTVRKIRLTVSAGHVKSIISLSSAQDRDRDRQSNQQQTTTQSTPPASARIKRHRPDKPRGRPHHRAFHARRKGCGAERARTT